MRNIEIAVVHCSATKINVNFSYKDLKHLHVGINNWSDIGYHYYYPRDGCEYVCRPIEHAGAHVKGYNDCSVGLCYEGGLDTNGKPCDTRTDGQKQAMNKRISLLRKTYGKIPVVGHRDLSPDQNKNGIIEAKERLKECPCYDAIDEHNTVANLKRFLLHYYNGIHR